MLPTPGSSEGSVVYYWADFLAFQTTRPDLRFLDSVKFIILCLYTLAAFKIYPCFLLSYSVLSLWVCLSLNNPFAALSVRRGEEGWHAHTLLSGLHSSLDVYFHLLLSSEPGSDPGHFPCTVSKALWSLPGGPLAIVLGWASSPWSWWYPCQSHCLSLFYFSTTPKPVHHSFHFDACGTLSRHSSSIKGWGEENQ